MNCEFGVHGQGLVSSAAGEDGGGIHGGVDGDFVPADKLQIGMRVGFGIGDAAACEEGDEFGVTFSGNVVTIFGSVRV